MKEVQGRTVTVNSQLVALAKAPKWKNNEKINTHVSLAGKTRHISQSIDYTDSYGEVTLSFRPTKDNIVMIEQCKKLIGENKIRIMDKETNLVNVFDEMSVSESPEVTAGEEIEVVFQGQIGVLG